MAAGASAQVSFARDGLTWLCYGMLGYYGYLLNSLGPVMPFLREELGLSYVVGSLHSSAFAGGLILSGLTGDLLARRFGRRVVFWAGAVGMSVGMMVLLLGRHPVVTVGGALVMGSMGSLLALTISALLSNRHGEKRAVALTEATVVASAFGGLAPLLIGQLAASGLGWRWGLLLAVAALPPVALLSSRLRFPKATEPPLTSDADGTPRAARLPGAYWAYWATLFLVVSVEFCMVFWAAEYLEREAGLPRTGAATAVSLFLGAMLIGRLAGSRLALGGRGAPGMLLASLGVTGAGFAVFWLSPSPSLAVAGLFVTGLGVANLYPFSLSLAIGAAGEGAEAASARVSLAAGTAIFSAPLLLGWLADGLGIGGAYGIVPVLLVAALAAERTARRLGTPMAAAVDDPTQRS